MATRASVKFVNNENQTLVNVYKHWDGNPEEFGKQILDIVSGGEVTKGIQGTGFPEGSTCGAPEFVGSFNGFSCLAASFVSLMKDKVGDIYIQPESSFGNLGEAYLYTAQEQQDGSVKVSVNRDSFTNGEVVDLKELLNYLSVLVTK